MYTCDAHGLNGTELRSHSLVAIISALVISFITKFQVVSHPSGSGRVLKNLWFFTCMCLQSHLENALTSVFFDPLCCSWLEFFHILLHAFSYFGVDCISTVWVVDQINDKLNDRFRVHTGAPGVFQTLKAYLPLGVYVRMVNLDRWLI